MRVRGKANRTKHPGIPQHCIHAYEYIQGLPQATVPDNSRSGVSRACRYDPDINPTCLDMAQHYGTAIVPAQKGKPRDKVKVETSVLVVDRWITAALRNRVFFSLKESNQAILGLVEKMNPRPSKNLLGVAMICIVQWIFRP